MGSTLNFLCTWPGAEVVKQGLTFFGKGLLSLTSIASFFSVYVAGKDSKVLSACTFETPRSLHIWKMVTCGISYGTLE